MVFFTIKKAPLTKLMAKAKNVPAGIKFAIYFNVLGIVVLEEPGEEVAGGPGGPSQEEPQAFGVYSNRRLKPVEIVDQGGKSDDSEDEEVKLDETFL